VGSLLHSAQETENDHLHSSMSGFLHYLPCNIQRHHEYAHRYFTALNTAIENPEVFVLKKKLKQGKNKWSKFYVKKLRCFRFLPRGNPHYCFKAAAPVAVSAQAQGLEVGTCSISHRWSLMKPSPHHQTRTEAEAERESCSRRQPAAAMSKTQ